MRRDPARLEAARVRLRALATGATAPAGPLPRRTAARRSPLAPAARATLAALPDARLRLAADAAAMDRLAALAAAIEIADDIATVIDRAGRERLDAALGPGVRQAAVAARALSGPRLRLGVEDLLAAHAEGRGLARGLWAAGFPPGLGLADGAPAGDPPPLDPARCDRLRAALAHAEAAVLSATGAAR